MEISGAEAVIAAASPFVGQGESACLVKVRRTEPLETTPSSFPSLELTSPSLLFRSSAFRRPDDSL